MSKLIKRGEEARKALEIGVNQLADTVKAVSYTHLYLLPLLLFLFSVEMERSGEDIAGTAAVLGSCLLYTSGVAGCQQELHRLHGKVLHQPGGRRPYVLYRHRGRQASAPAPLLLQRGLLLHGQRRVLPVSYTHLRPRATPQARTSSLKSIFKGSTSSNFRSSGRPPTLWWLFTAFTVLVPDSMMSG